MADELAPEVDTAVEGRQRPGPTYYVRRSQQLARAAYSGFNQARRRVNQNAIGYKLGSWSDARVAVYFPDNPNKLYQLTQWLPVFEQLHQQLPVVIVTRSQFTYAELESLTWLPRVCVPRFPHLTDLYQHSEIAVALYVNNGARNFQSLSWQRMLHVHINHGESDKLSMVSNQAKAYDRVLVAGDAARQRHQAALIEFNDDLLMPIGRPQLDLLPAAAVGPTDRTTILYAPTWHGETVQNNYSSVDVFGPELVTALVAVPNSRVIYKPHPRTATAIEAEIATAHSAILDIISAAAAADPDAGHTALLDADVLGVLPAADIFVGDVSSVTLDYLYLRADKPLILCDRNNNRAGLIAESPAAAAADVVTADNVAGLTDLIVHRISGDDPNVEARQEMRELYFGAHQPGQSVDDFISVVASLARRRDKAVANIDAGQVVGLRRQAPDESVDPDVEPGVDLDSETPNESIAPEETVDA